ncbi:hypothetical protein [Gordonibacter pamelaeae]|uniref:hypothetical protein n=1 Tax=Gordonibacter pamelaeae TaxID=471189 RepID=UPI003A8D2D4E
MMPTNEERREVAAKLRDFERLRTVFAESSICAFSDALGCGYLDWEQTCARLADLIEPAPERTCRDIAEPPKGGGFWPAPHFKCSECGGEHVSIDYVSYCPNCGAKVVDE